MPRIAQRGRALLDQIVALLRAYGYATAETAHDCGEIGGLGQSRKRFLLVARHAAKVPPFLYEAPRRPLRSVGEVLERFPLPGDTRGGPMHRVPLLQWKTWVRLAFVEAGGDWRSLNRLSVVDGHLADFALLPEREWQGNTLGVLPWDRPSGTVTGNGRATTGRFAVADPRHFGLDYGQWGVRRWDEPTGTITSQRSPGQGAFAVADPRWADDRPAYLTGGHYGVLRWQDTSGAVSSAGQHDNGRWSVADPRPALPAQDERLACIIRSLDGTWHRPFTTLELAALQGLVCPEEQLVLDGLSDAAWRERIGNAVPPPAAQAIAETMGRTLLMAWAGEGFALSNAPIWVHPIATALQLADATPIE